MGTLSFVFTLSPLSSLWLRSSYRLTRLLHLPRTSQTTIYNWSQLNSVPSYNFHAFFYQCSFFLLESQECWIFLFLRERLLWTSIASGGSSRGVQRVKIYFKGKCKQVELWRICSREKKKRKKGLVSWLCLWRWLYTINIFRILWEFWLHLQWF